MQSLGEFLESIPYDFDKEEIYKKALPYLVEEHFFAVLTNQLSYKEFHQKIINLAKLPHGVGLGVAIMAQVNIAGKTLQIISDTNPSIKEKLTQLVKGELVISLGVSEPNWKGRLVNLKSTLSPTNSGKFLLNGEKSFFTNGHNCNYYLVVVKLEQNYRVLILDKSKQGMMITKFSIPFAVEATHCKIRFENVEIDSQEILDFDYSKFAENLRLSEMLSLSSIFCGYAEFTLEQIKQYKDFVEILKSNEDYQKRILRCKILIQMLKSRVLEISEEKDKTPELELKTYFPYGTELVAEEFYSILEEIFPQEKLEPFLQNKQLFTYKDLLNESYIKKAGKKVCGII